MARAQGNPQVAKKLWPQIGQMMKELRVAGFGHGHKC
jgi:hypothetical protein